jgi:hypothetical protein
MEKGYISLLQSRGPGQYGYVIGRPDLEEWGEPSLETFESLAEADDDGCNPDPRSLFHRITKEAWRTAQTSRRTEPKGRLALPLL